jgi:FkbM family methyltransferase
MYSQNNEEKIILDYFSNKVGKFLDIGAYNPFVFSNTRKLVELGWSGVYVEPSPKCFESFLIEYKDNNKITLCNFALGEKNGTIDFYDSNGDAISTTEVSHKKTWESKGGNYTKISVPVVTTPDFLEKHGENVDFISIDTEKTNIKILDSIEFLFWDKISMLCIEHDGQYEYIKSRLPQFKVLLLNGENLILSK